ncbi:MAG: hypothetical protein ACYSWO_25215 [Planctomycetota bacterium]|jgi:hypothetical protein
MVQFATPEHQKGGKKKKPKKELGAWMDIVQMVAPIAASVVGTPLAGAAVSALLEGAESKLEGGSWKEALLKGGLSGGISAATGGLAGGADKLATEAAKKTLTEGAKGAGKKLGTEGVGQFLKQGSIEAAKPVIGKTGEELTKAVTGSLSEEAAGRFTEHLGGMQRDAAIDKLLAGVTDGGEASKKQKFFEHAQSLGEMGLGAYTAGRAEAAGRGQAGAMQNQALMQRIQGAMEGQYQRPGGSRYYKPYGV